MVFGFVRGLKAGIPPALEKGGDSAFMLAARKQLAFFLTTRVHPKGSGSVSSTGEAPQFLYGAEAARLRYDRVCDAADTEE